MKFILAIMATCISHIASAQYYYKDIVVNKEINALNEKIKKAKAVSVKVKSFDFDDTEIENFLCEQEIENNGKHTFTTTGSPYVGENHLHSYFTAQSKIIRSVDSNPLLIIQNIYDYQNSNLSKITINTIDIANKTRLAEQHIWQYDDKNVPTKMYLVKNNLDTLKIQIIKDSITQMPIEEIVYEKGKEFERYYYYYDDKNRLTDVVKYNRYKKKLLPELIFEYDEQNQIIKKSIFVTGTNDYTNWFYKYDDKGLKTAEQCFLKGNLFRGKLYYYYKYE